MESVKHTEEAEVSDTAAYASNEPTTAERQGGDIEIPQQPPNDPPHLYILDSSDTDVSTISPSVQSAFSPDSSDEEDGPDPSNVSNVATFHETLPEVAGECIARDRIEYEESRGYSYKKRPLRAFDVSGDDILVPRVQRNQPYRPIRTVFQHTVEDSESHRMRPEIRQGHRDEPLHWEDEEADDTTSPSAGQFSDTAETLSDPPQSGDNSHSPAAQFSLPSPLSPTGTLDFEKLSLLTKGTAWDDEDSDELFNAAVRLATSPTEDADGQGTSAPPTGNAADHAAEQLNVEDNSLTRVPSHMHLADLSKEVTPTNAGKNDESPLDDDEATASPVSPVESGSDLATHRDGDPDDDDAPPSPVSPLDQSILFSDFDQGLEEEHGHFSHHSQYLSHARSNLEYESGRCLRDACIETRHQLIRSNKACRDLNKRLGEKDHEMRESAKLAEEAKRHMDIQLKQLESDLEDRDVLVGRHFHELTLMTEERDQWKNCAAYRKPAWLAAQRKQEEVEAQAERVEQGEDVDEQRNADTQTDNTQYRDVETQTADPTLGIRASGDANHGARLRRRGSMRWPPSIRPALEEHIATWVNDTHQMETGEKPTTALNNERVATLLGAGFTPFDDIISALRADGYLFRDDRFAQDLEEWLWDQDSLVDRTEVMYVARQYNESSTLVQQIHSALCEISELHMKLHQSRRGGPMSKVELSELEQTRLMTQSLLGRAEDTNAELSNEIESLRGQLAASEEVVREFENALASAPDQAAFEELQNELRECREHGQSLETLFFALQDSEKALKQELAGLRVKPEQPCLRCPEKDEETERLRKLLETPAIQDGTCSRCSDTQGVIRNQVDEIQRLRKLLFQVADYSNLEREYVPQTLKSPMSRTEAALGEAKIQHGIGKAIAASLANEKHPFPPAQPDPVSPSLRPRAREFEVARKQREESRELVLKVYRALTGEENFRYIPLAQRRAHLTGSA